VADRPAPGEGWVYEHIVAALPGASVRPRTAIALQFAGFEAAVLALAVGYGRPAAALAGTAIVVVATAGSAAMVTIARSIRAAAAPARYRQLLFGSNVEVVLGVLAYAALATVLVVEPEPGLLARWLGASPPAPAVFFAFVLGWDVCYRMGVGWWASVVGCWRSLTGAFDRETAAAYRRADLATMGFATVQLALVPVVWDVPLLALAVLGHVGAVWIVSGASLAALRVRRIRRPGSP